MFLYTDSGKTLKPVKALSNYRLLLHGEYVSFARLARSAFTLLEAFADVPAGRKTTHDVEWIAFPKSAGAGNAEIDTERFRFQDEYVEWAVTRSAGKIRQVTFTTEFLAYYEALAMAGAAALIAAIQAAIPGSNPKKADLFGPGFDPDTASEMSRRGRFASRAQQNPWINGTKGILCLGHRSSTLGALFDLVAKAAIPNPAVPSGDICPSLGGSCVPERNSDPSVAAAVQSLARNGRSLSLTDPAGIEIVRLSGVWRIKDQEIDINDPAANSGAWTVSRGRKRGVLKVTPNLFLDDEPVTSGAQVAASLRVKASVVSAADTDLPEWSRMG
ncbi:MAG: hypothetical protein ACRD44_07455, partial [Bryobacteraceae bacterium]